MGDVKGKVYCMQIILIGEGKLEDKLCIGRVNFNRISVMFGKKGQNLGQTVSCAIFSNNIGVRIKLKCLVARMKMHARLCYISHCKLVKKDMHCIVNLLKINNRERLCFVAMRAARIGRDIMSQLARLVQNSTVMTCRISLPSPPRSCYHCYTLRCHYGALNLCLYVFLLLCYDAFMSTLQGFPFVCLFFRLPASVPRYQSVSPSFYA